MNKQCFGNYENNNNSWHCLGCTVVSECKIEKEKRIMSEKTVDMVKEPSHYKHGRFETIDEMLIVFGPQRTYDYCIIAAWKYRARAAYKENFEQDMKKADEFLDLAKQIQEANKEMFYGSVNLIKSEG